MVADNIITIIIEIVLIMSMVISSTMLVKKNSNESRKVFAISFVILIAVGVIFSLVQILTVLKVIDMNIEYSPLNILSLVSIIYWIAYTLKRSTLFDKVTG